MRIHVIVNDHGRQARHYPLHARKGEDLFIFYDFRTPFTVRYNYAIALVGREEIEFAERLIVAPLPLDCPNGVHDWQPVCVDGAVTSGRCPACGTVEWLTEAVRGFDRDLIAV